MKKRPPARTPTKSPDPADGLLPAQREFCLAYLANGFNATAAYAKAYPDAADESARRAGSRLLLTNVDVQAFLKPQLDAHWKALQMDGEEALARVALDARADLRALYDKDGKPLHPKDWPDELANSIEAVDLKDDGTYKVKLTSKGHARRTILEVTGKIKSPLAESVDALAAAILADRAAHTSHE